MLVRFRFFLWVLLLPFYSFANLENPSQVSVELVQEEATVLPNRPFWVALRFNLKEGWHVYWKNPGDAGMPLKVEWNLPPGFEAGPLQWPFPEKFTVAEMVGFGYTNEVILLTLITPPAKVDNTDKLDLQAKIKWLLCSSLTCQPGETSATLPLTISSETPQPRKEFLSLFELARSKIPQTHIEVKTVRKQGIVQLEVPQDQNENIRGVDFFPEDKNVIDHSTEATLAKGESETNRYFVNLKEGDEVGAASQYLKGVLVLHKQKGGIRSVEAIDIDSLIEYDVDDDLLALLDLDEEQGTLSTAAPVEFQGGLMLALVFAFVGGMILNLMPCVLPVLSLKVMSFVKMAGQSRSLTIKHGLVFALGVVLSFWCLATFMLVLRSYGQSVGWGFQLQEPFFVVILISILFLFALSLFGVFEWGLIFASWAGQTQSETMQKTSGYPGSFFNGVLATAVATPCTGPFLGSAVGFAVTLPAIQSLMIFTFLGIGMSFPYLLLAVFPSFLRFMPKPGAWMETFKQLMGFLLLATVLWLLWVFSAQTDAFSLISLLAALFCFSVGGWIYGQGCTPISKRKTQILALVCALLCVGAGIKVILLSKSSWDVQTPSVHGTNEWQGWEEFSPQRLDELRQAGKPVLIDFTAKWCLVCQANHLVLNSDQVTQKLNQLGVVKMKADWTKSDPVITEALSRFGRNSVPLYVLYGPNKDQEPLILPQVLTPQGVMEALQKQHAL